MNQLLVSENLPLIPYKYTNTLIPYMYSTLKRRGNERFHVVSTWNTCGVFVGYIEKFYSGI